MAAMTTFMLRSEIFFPGDLNNVMQPMWFSIKNRRSWSCHFWWEQAAKFIALRWQTLILRNQDRESLASFAP
mgnify:FL=1